MALLAIGLRTGRADPAGLLGGGDRHGSADGLGAAASAQATSSPSLGASPIGSPAATSAVAHYAERGLSFDYPAQWRFSPVVSRFSFQATSGYFGTISVTQEQICQKTALSAKCVYRGYDLPPGNVMVLLSHVGNGPIDPVAIFDHPAKGSRVTVGDMAAVFSERVLVADRSVLSWMIARPDAAGNWIEFDADIRGPDDGSLRAGVEAMIASFRFDPPPMPLATSEAAINAVVAKAIGDLRAGARRLRRASRSRPVSYGTRPSGGFRRSAPQRAPIDLLGDHGGHRCPPAAMELVATWKAASDRAPGTYRTVEWLLARRDAGEPVRSRGPGSARRS